jgi:hypothetical protein
MMQLLTSPLTKVGVVYGSLQRFTVIWAGTMDAMMTAKGDVWNPPGEVVNNCNQEVDEVLRYVPIILPCPTQHHKS